jgi:hypothetical protein
MAYQFVDPAPSIPRGFQRVVVPNRKAMSRVLLGRPAKRNPDVAIVTINPLPQHQVAFNNIRDVLHDFLRNHARVAYTFIQPCPFGQAYVKFVYFHDRISSFTTAHISLGMYLSLLLSMIGVLIIELLL